MWGFAVRVMLGLHDGAGGGEGGAVGVGWGRGGVNESYVMDGLKDNDVISIALKPLLLWPISIVGGVFAEKGGNKNSRGGGANELELRY